MRWLIETLRVRKERGERGATAVEYALTVAMIAAVIIAGAVLLGTNSNATYRCTLDSVEAQTTRC